MSIKNESVKIYVVGHKPFKVPRGDAFQVIGVGPNSRSVSPEGVSDDLGENIAWKNPSYCELTALYWIWKNDKSSDIIGLCHYRRYFSRTSLLASERHFVQEADIVSKLKKTDIILPKPLIWRNNTALEMYKKGDGLEKDIQITRQVLQDMDPKMVVHFDKFMSGTRGYYWNMFIMRRELLEEYCEWLFPILAEIEKRVDITGYTVSQLRVFGYLSERLLNVWLMEKQPSITEVPVVKVDDRFRYRLKQLTKRIFVQMVS